MPAYSQLAKYNSASELKALRNSARDGMNSALISGVVPIEAGHCSALRYDFCDYFLFNTSKALKNMKHKKVVKAKFRGVFAAC